jgi:glycine betaine/proline transport system substrate-binding protein
MRKKLLGVVAIMVCAAFIASCAQQGAQSKKKLRLAYVEWSSEIASTNVVKAVLEEYMNYDVEIIPVGAAAMWQSVSTGDADGFVAAWLPTTHESYLNKVKDSVEDLGPNLKGTRIGLVVPQYVDIDSIPELNSSAKKFDGRIIGIDPGAGIMKTTEKAIKDYGLSNIELMEGSGATMTASLADAVKNKEWVCVTGWTPHWKFMKWDLKYLKDPKNIYGDEEYIKTIVRKGLKQEDPVAYQFLDNFYWTPADMQKVMLANQETDKSPYENALEWVRNNEAKVKKWIPKSQ